MKSIRMVALASVASALLVLPLNAAAQGPANQDTFFTFSQSVELPGKTLPAGTYFFQLADSPSNRHIVKVMSQDRKELHATLLAIPFYSNDRPSDKPQVRFMETPAQAAGGANTNAIKIWFYPGNTTGHEFIYPRSQAMRIASRTGESVLTTKTDAEVSDTVAEADLTRVDRAGTDVAVDTSNRATTETQTTARAETQPAPETAETRPAETRTADTRATDTRTTETPATTARTERTPPRSDLPNTAGLLPLLAVIGIGSLVGSRMLRRSRRA
jgi:hypothetical protein